jgi:glyoxylase-like metal-dependent hydrolase (beta-lactamase superfamily II)
MQRRNFLRQSAAGLTALSLLPAHSLLARGLFPTAGSFTSIRNNVGYYTERGGTIGWLLEPGATVMIDTHTGGNSVFKGLFKTHLAHENAKTNLSNNAKEDSEVLLPGDTYAKEWQRQVGDEIVQLNYFGPGHTNGDSVIHFQNANVAHLGDLLFNRRFPYIDPGAGGTFTNWAKVLKKVRKYYDKDTVFIFGHAADSYPVTGSVNDVRAMQNYIEQLLRYVKKEKKKGTALEQLKAQTVTIPGAEEWRYGERLRDRNLEVAWEEV